MQHSFVLIKKNEIQQRLLIFEKKNWLKVFPMNEFYIEFY
jgi:hypothetical protein